MRGESSIDRRLVIAISFLILVLAALTMAGLLSAAGAPAADQAARVPDPVPCAMSAPAAPASTRGRAAVAVRHLAPAGMSGEFAKRLLACRDTSLAPAIHLPHDTWRPKGGGVRAGHHPAPRCGGAAATRVA